jgi:putative FmdB family regulatory protein
MPLFEYECDACGETYEIQCKVNERMRMSNQICPECREGKLKKLIGNRGGFRLKPGSVGWADEGYATHYGDAENFKARSAGKPEPFPRDIGEQ